MFAFIFNSSQSRPDHIDSHQAIFSSLFFSSSVEILKLRCHRRPPLPISITWPSHHQEEEEEEEEEMVVVVVCLLIVIRRVTCLDPLSLFAHHTRSVKAN